MQVFGKEIDFNICRLSDASRIELALRHMEEAEKKIQAKAGDKLSTILKGQLDMFRNFFRETTGQDVMGDCEDLFRVKEEYRKFLSEIKKQKEAIIKFSYEDIK